MLPGSHLVVIGREEDALGARVAGLQLRDTLLILLPGVTSLFAYLFRQPLEGTVAENVLKHGTGGLWIDGCRVGVSTRTNSSAPRKERATMQKGMVTGTVTQQFDHGRWPSNLLLVHGPGCVRVGTTEYNNGKGGPSHRSPETLGKAQGGWDSLRTHRDVALCYADEHGLETVAAWDCQPDCPVRLLDAQSGLLKSGDPTNAVRNEGGNMLQGQGKGVPLSGYGDSGGASRFFPQFASLSEALGWLARLTGTGA